MLHNCNLEEVFRGMTGAQLLIQQTVTNKASFFVTHGKSPQTSGERNVVLWVVACQCQHYKYYVKDKFLVLWTFLYIQQTLYIKFPLSFCVPEPTCDYSRTEQGSEIQSQTRCANVNCELMDSELSTWDRITQDGCLYQIKTGSEWPWPRSFVGARMVSG